MALECYTDAKWNMFNNLMWLSLLVAVAFTQEVACGCCNDNYWCDGDPAFVETPDVVQEEGSPYVVVQWNSDYILLSKCVDFFYVEYQEVTNKSSDSFSIAPVFMETNNHELDEWEDSLKAIVHHYSANISVERDRDYIMRAVAVDKGMGWGEYEGEATVYSPTIRYHSRPLAAELHNPVYRENVNGADESQMCSVTRFCNEFALDWIRDVGTLVTTGGVLGYQDPMSLPNIDLRYGEDTRRNYHQGKMHNLANSAVTSVSTSSVEDGLVYLKVCHCVKLLRVSYLWHSFITMGKLNLYHTCGKELPLTIFQDVDETEVSSLVSPNCCLNVCAVVAAPLDLSTNEIVAVRNVSASLERFAFKYDVTWFSAYFHHLDLLWRRQKPILRDKLGLAFRKAYIEAFEKMKAHEWVRRKVQEREQ